MDDINQHMHTIQQVDWAVISNIANSEKLMHWESKTGRGSRLQMCMVDICPFTPEGFTSPSGLKTFHPLKTSCRRHWSHCISEGSKCSRRDNPHFLSNWRSFNTLATTCWPEWSKLGSFEAILRGKPTSHFLFLECHGARNTKPTQKYQKNVPGEPVVSCTLGSTDQRRISNIQRDSVDKLKAMMASDRQHLIPPNFKVCDRDSNDVLPFHLAVQGHVKLSTLTSTVWKMPNGYMFQQPLESPNQTSHEISKQVTCFPSFNHFFLKNCPEPLLKLNKSWPACSCFQNCAPIAPCSRARRAVEAASVDHPRARRHKEHLALGGSRSRCFFAGCMAAVWQLYGSCMAVGLEKQRRT